MTSLKKTCLSEMNLQKNLWQQGFTLIELMIVVAIIGILSAIALPLYGEYAAKTQATEAFGLLSGAKTPLLEAISNEGLKVCDQNNPGSWYDGIVRKGTYVSDISVSKGTKGCLVVATFDTTGVNDKISGRHIAMSVVAKTGVWACGSNLPNSVRPAACKGGDITSAP